jgi:putative membrane protein
MADTDDKEELAEERTEAAERRTDFAEDRTVQATERTFAGWMRTAFAAIGVGLGFQALFGELEPPGVAKAIASLFIILGVIVAFTAERRACAAFDRLSTHEIERPETPSIRWMSWSVIAGGLTLVAALWLLHDPG